MDDMSYRDILDAMQHINPEAIVYEGLDEAVLGVAERPNLGPVLAYDFGKIIDILMRDMGEEEALEYFDFNIAGLWAGEYTPLIVSLPEVFGVH